MGHALVLTEASGEPAERGLSQSVFDIARLTSPSRCSKDSTLTEVSVGATSSSRSSSGAEKLAPRSASARPSAELGRSHGAGAQKVAGSQWRKASPGSSRSAQPAAARKATHGVAAVRRP
eukprot:scaffold13747_cov37-Phaeocystis_antarctica.AAC.2